MASTVAVLSVDMYHLLNGSNKMELIRLNMFLRHLPMIVLYAIAVFLFSIIMPSLARMAFIFVLDDTIHPMFLFLR